MLCSRLVGEVDSLGSEMFKFGLKGVCIYCWITNSSRNQFFINYLCFLLCAMCKKRQDDGLGGKTQTEYRLNRNKTKQDTAIYRACCTVQ